MIIKYVNSKNQELNLIQNPYRMLTSTDLFNFSWNYNKNNDNSITDFYSEEKQATVSIVISGKTEAEYNNNLKTIMEFFDADVRNKTPGKLYVNDYYLEGYLFASAKPRKYLKTNFTQVDFTFTSKSLDWINSEIVDFSKNDSESSSEYLDFPYDFSYDFKEAVGSSSLINNSYSPCDYELEIFGPATNPVIAINDWNYGVNATIASGEKVIINSEERTIKKISANGVEKNLFYARFYDFEFTKKIDAGNNPISKTGNFDFTIKLLKKRSEPLW